MIRGLASVLSFLLWLSASALIAAAQAPPSELDGLWKGHNWGDVYISGAHGIYTDSYSNPFGMLQFDADGEGGYVGEWGEVTRRKGTFKISLLDDRKTIAGTYSTAPDSRAGHTIKSGKIFWLKVEGEAKVRELLDGAKLDLIEIQLFQKRLAELLKDRAVEP